MITGYVTFIKAHETILALCLGVALVWGVSGKIESVIARHDASQEVQAQIIANIQAKKDEALAAQVATDKATFEALQTKLDARDAALTQANTALATALTKQQKTDDVMTTSELITRWSTLVPTVRFDGATMTPDGGIDVSPANAHATVDVLEQVPVLTQQLANSSQQTTDALALLMSDNKQVTDLTAEVSGLKLKAVDDKNVCNAEIKVVKDDARKSKRRWFTAGVAVGFAARQVIKTYLGF